MKLLTKFRGGVLPAALAEFQHTVHYSNSHNGEAIIILVDGSPVMEYYHNGFTASDVKDVESVTKSFVGVIHCQLIADTLATGFNDLVKGVITEWNGASAGKDACTVRRLISLTSGLDNPALPGTVPAYATSIAADIPDGEIGDFKYGANPFGVYAEYVHRLVQPTYDDWVNYLQTEVLTPAGVTISSVSNTLGGAGEPNLSHGANMTAMNAALFGEYMRLGIVADPNLLTITQAGPDYWAYGMGWWRTTDLAGGLAGTADEGTTTIPESGFLAAGAFGQRVYVLPDINVVCVRFGTMDVTYSDADFLDLLITEAGAL